MAAVGGLVRAVEGRAAVEQVGRAPVLPAAGRQHAVEHGREVGGAVHDGGVDDLSGAGVAGVPEGGEDTYDEVERAAGVVAEEVGRGVRRAVGGPGHAEGAGHGDVADVVPGGPRERALLAPAGHPPVDERGVAGQRRLGSHAQPLGDAGAEALEEDVGPLDEVEHGAGAVGGLEVDEDGPLVAIGDVVRRVDAQPRAAGAVDAHDVGTEVAEQHGRERARPDPRELDHAHSGERTVVCACHAAPTSGLL